MSGTVGGAIFVDTAQAMELQATIGPGYVVPALVAQGLSNGRSWAVEWMAEHHPSWSPPAEALAGAHADSRIVPEVSGGVLLNAAPEIEYLGSVTPSWVEPLIWEAGSQFTAAAPAETVASLRSDANGAPEFQGTGQFDAVGPSELVSAVRLDQPAAAEWLASPYRGFVAAAEQTSTGALTINVAAEMTSLLSAIMQNSVAAIEILNQNWAFGGPIPSEWSAGFRWDVAVQFESAMTLGLDVSPGTETLASFSGDASVAVSTLASVALLAVDWNVPLEWWRPILVTLPPPARPRMISAPAIKRGAVAPAIGRTVAAPKRGRVGKV